MGSLACRLLRGTWDVGVCLFGVLVSSFSPWREMLERGRVLMRLLQFPLHFEFMGMSWEHFIYLAIEGSLVRFLTFFDFSRSLIAMI